MSSNNPAQRLRGIVDNIADQESLLAVVRAPGIVSEAARRLPAELKD
jgi:hypothetical protein